MKLRPTLFFLLIFTASISFAQQRMPVQAISEVLVHGTSTLHDWTMICEQFDGSAKMTIEEGSITDVSDFNFSIAVKGMKSGKSGMDKNVYKAMSEPEYPNIEFKSTNVDIRPQGEGVYVVAQGELTIAGVTNTVTLEADGRKSGEHWVFSGKEEVHTPDYGVERVSAMMGAMKSGEDVVIDFDIIL